MSNRIGNPLPYFPDKRGLPMDGGKLYIGEAGEDPQTNPIDVFLDEAMTQEATQPIPIIGGSPCQDGNPRSFYIDEAVYSLRVRDRDGAEMFYVPRVTNPVAEGTGGGGSDPGTDGEDGIDAISATLSNESIILPADASGAITSYANATGIMQVFSGKTNVSSSFTLSIASGGNPQNLTVNFTSQSYAITDGFDAGETGATLSIRATGLGQFAGITIDKVVTLGKAQPGATGAGSGGVDAVVFTVSREAIVFFTYADGTVASFTNASGVARLMQGQTDVTAAATLAASASGCTGSINTATNSPVSGQPKGYYRITAMATDEATLTLTAVYNSVTYTKVVSFTKARAGYEIVTSLPATNLFEGRFVYLTTDDKLYRYNGTAWTRETAAADLAGQITSTQITDGAISTPKLAAGSVATDKLVANAVTSDKINAGAITAAKVAASNVITITAQIADAVITEAKIANLAVSTLKIGNNAVTVPLVMGAAGTLYGNGGYQTILSGTVTLDYPGVLFVLFTAGQAYASGIRLWEARIRVNGTVIAAAGGAGGYTSCIGMSAGVNVGSGVNTIAIEWLGADASVTLGSATAFAQGAMK